jgi:hypothetical protein
MTNDDYTTMTDAEYAEACAAAREEIRASAARIRAEVNEMPIRLLVNRFTARRQQRNADAQEAAAARWGAPSSGGSFADGSAGRPGPRNSRIPTVPARNVRFR